jgi:hypothetical protein
MRSVEFHPEAAAEFLAAVQFYEAQAEKLGFDFLSAVRRAAERIVDRGIGSLVSNRGLSPPRATLEGYRPQPRLSV